MNQRYNQSGRQLVEKSKVFTKYKNHVDNLIQDSQMSYNQIQTPGWTSLANTQQSKQFNIDQHNKHPNNEHPQNNKKVNNRYHNEILDRLNSLPKIDKQQNFYPKIRLFSSIDKNKNVIVYGSARSDQNKKLQTPKSINSQKPFANNLSSQKNKQFDSQRKQQINLTQKKRIYSVKQVQMNLKDRIKDRISSQSTKKPYRLSKFEEKEDITKNANIANQYSKPFALKQTSQNKNQYLKNHLKKLQHQSQSLTNLKPTPFQKLENSNKIHSSVKLRPQFNSITIHQHLYQNSIKLELKKNMTRMVQDSYNRVNILTFMPEISERSSFIAQEKFKKENCQPNTNHYHQNCDLIQKKLRLNTFSSLTKNNPQLQSKKKQMINQAIQQRTLQKLFNFLANKKQFLLQKDLQQNIEKLPLALIQTLDPLITTIFKVQKMDSKSFILFFTSNKSLKSKINNIVLLIQKSFAQFIQNKENNFNQVNNC